MAGPALAARRVTVRQILGRRPPAAAFRAKAEALMRLCPAERYAALAALSYADICRVRAFLPGGPRPPRGLWPGASAADLWLAVRKGALTPHFGPGGVTFDANEVRALAAAHPKRKPRD